MKTQICLTIGVLSTGLLARGELVAYFPLDEGTPGESTEFIDDVIDNPHHGVGDAQANNHLATWVDDPERGVVLNSPAHNRFLAGTQDIDLRQGFTWSFWAKVRQGETGPKVVIGTRNRQWHKITVAKGVDGVGFVDFGSGTYDLADGKWHHLALVGSDQGSGDAGDVEVSLYLDGVKLASANTARTLTYNGQMEIGGSTKYSEFADVRLDEIGIWNEALPESVIVGLANGDPVLATERSDIKVVAFHYDRVGQVVSLTWEFESGTRYRVLASINLIDWTREVGARLDESDDEDLSDEDLLTFTVDLADHGWSGEPDLFFRVRPED